MQTIDPIDQFIQAFPDVQITPSQAGLIAANVRPEDADVWQDTINFYIGNFSPEQPNRYNPRRISTMLDVFRDRKRKKESANAINSTNNGNGRQTSIDRLKGYGFIERYKD